MSFGYFFQPNDLNEIKEDAEKWLKKASHDYSYFDGLQISRLQTSYIIDDGNLNPHPFFVTNWLFFFFIRALNCPWMSTGDGAQGPFETWELMNKWAIESHEAFHRQGIKSELEPVEAECLGRPNVRKKFIAPEDLEKTKRSLVKEEVWWNRCMIR